MRTYRITTSAIDGEKFDAEKASIVDIIEITFDEPVESETVFEILKAWEDEEAKDPGDAVNWNKLNPVDRAKISRVAGFSESDCALLAKIKWEGFPKQIVDALYLIDWHKVLA